LELALRPTKRVDRFDEGSVGRRLIGDVFFVWPEWRKATGSTETVLAELEFFMTIKLEGVVASEFELFGSVS
jgi:hypothetical protein